MAEMLPPPLSLFLLIKEGRERQGSSKAAVTSRLARLALCRAAGLPSTLVRGGSRVSLVLSGANWKEESRQEPERRRQEWGDISEQRQRRRRPPPSMVSALAFFRLVLGCLWSSLLSPSQGARRGPPLSLSDRAEESPARAVESSSRDDAPSRLLI